MFLELDLNVRKVIITNIPIEGRVGYPNEHGFFYSFSS